MLDSPMQLLLLLADIEANRKGEPGVSEWLMSGELSPRT